ncbi:MraY family glycosyltransferase [Thermodesulfobacteriota bacterium]
MTTILTIFSASLILSLLLTPLVGKLGIKFGAIDIPRDRKVQKRSIPRTGGLAVFLSFVLALILSQFIKTNISGLLILDRQNIFLFIGAIICFGTGLFDDFKRLGPAIKFLFQTLGASVAFYGGIQIGGINLFGIDIQPGLFSYFFTVFWFVLFINAVNLVDGLDGLAGGVVVFASTVMVILSVLREDYLTALFFSALGGSVLGFLRYNFNPATIFLGDGGSYFLGYAVAGFSILGSVKTQVGAAMLIPLIALGVPLFDTILSPIRRWVRGRQMFQPDSDHVHHRLVEMGMTAQKAVWIIYATTFFLCVMAVIFINIRDERAGLFLIVLGVGGIIFVRKLGYLEYFGTDKVYGWFKDVSDATGFSHDRRSFLNIQMEIAQSESIEELWSNASLAFKKLGFDMAEMSVKAITERCKAQGAGQMSTKQEEAESEKADKLMADEHISRPERSGDPDLSGEAGPQISQISQMEEGEEAESGIADKLMADELISREAGKPEKAHPGEIRSAVVNEFHEAGSSKREAQSEEADKLMADELISGEAGSEKADKLMADELISGDDQISILNEKNENDVEAEKRIRAKKYDNITLWGWSREGFDRYGDLDKDCLMKMELPLIDGENRNFGTLWIVKDLRRDAISHYTLRRVEHLRRSLIGAMEKLSKF